VLTGRRASLDALGRLVYSARRIGGDQVVVFDFRGALSDTGASTVPRLGDSPSAASETLAEILDEERAATPDRALVAVGD
jgi:MerR family transcriptional regulator, light-induced transcriptional regulator